MIRFKILDNTVRMSVSDAKVIYSGAGEPYTGSYTVTPKLEPQTMATKNKMMQDNVTIEKIPVVVASNSAGGNTIIIGG